MDQFGILRMMLRDWICKQTEKRTKVKYVPAYSIPDPCFVFAVGSAPGLASRAHNSRSTSHRSVRPEQRSKESPCSSAACVASGLLPRALGWSARELAKHSHVGATTISRFESGKPANPSTLALLRQAFEKAGVVFTDDGGIVPPPENECEGLDADHRSKKVFRYRFALRAF